MIFLLASAPTFSGESQNLPEAWQDSHYGSCYRSLKAGMASIYGGGYQSDENITQEKLVFGTVKMVISADRTSGNNAGRTIFEQRPNNLWCVVLSSPPVSQIVPTINRNKLSRPNGWETLTQAEPGFDEVKVLYAWDPAKAVYFPVQCFHVFKTKSEKFNCAAAYQ
jgi:hypothetical protein